MKSKILLSAAALIISFQLLSCSNSDEKGIQNVPPPADGKKELLDLKIGMSVDEVLKITGDADLIDTIGFNPDGKLLVQWHFGDNQDICFLEGKLSSIVLDEKKQDEEFHRIMDSAAAADKLKNGNH